MWRSTTPARWRDETTETHLSPALKDAYGSHHFVVRGHAKVFCHLMFGALVLTVNQLIRLTI